MSVGLVRHVRKTLGPMLRRWSQGALELVFPPRCVCCGGEELPDATPVCADCRVELVASQIACPRCARFLRAAGACPYCVSQPQRFEMAFALGRYRASLREIVLRLKRPRTEALAAAMADLLWRQRGAELAQFAPDVVAPVPMHWRRRIMRGANSAELLARRLARRGGWPLETGALRRQRSTRPQASLLPRQRLRNVRGAFALARGLKLDSARVLLVDDVLTTGATANEAARVLLRAGASVVGVAVLARAEPAEAGLA